MANPSETLSIEDYASQTEFHGVQRQVLERAVRALMASEGFPRNSAFTSNRIEAMALIRGVTGASVAISKTILLRILHT